MQIAGFSPHGTRHETDAFHMQLADKVRDFLREQARGGNRKHVKKVGHTLDSVRRNGFRGVEDSTLFVREGKFPSGRPGVAHIAVYAAKSYQLRVYGGLIKLRDQAVFLCPEAAIKQRNKADQDQLRRIAQILGSYL